MLREYLTSAQDVLVAKKEIYDVKQQRLLLAEDEYKLLNALAASRSSCKFPPFDDQSIRISIIPFSLFSVSIHSVFIE